MARKNKKDDRKYRRNWGKAKYAKDPQYFLKYSRKYYQNHREQWKKYTREYRKRNAKTIREKDRESNLKSKYNLTLEDYDELLDKQNGVCAICGGINRAGKRLGVDHCHRSGKVRGLLCDTCNLILGQFDDQIKILQKVIKYLQRVDK
jgi:hypothetical protein